MDPHQTYFVVLRRTGPRWDPSRPFERQCGWPEHASFMDGLVDAGFVILSGPLADEHRVVLAVAARLRELLAVAYSSLLLHRPGPRRPDRWSVARSY